jgi:hypothetical protein
MRRLSRRIVGASLLEEAALVTRTMDRLEHEPRPSLVPDRLRTVRTGACKNAARTATASPNAPQLFRLVRHPFALDVVRPVRSKTGQTKRVVREHVSLADLSQRVRVTRMPTRQPVVELGARRPSPLNRASVDAWLGGTR